MSAACRRARHPALWRGRGSSGLIESLLLDLENGE
jgi:hypothetical protein